MRRDAIFYRLFQQSPSLLFDLLDIVPETNNRLQTAISQGYRFESVAAKEPTFMIDGVFLPPAEQAPGIVFFAEVQMQPDQKLYERLFSESMAYFYRNRDSFSDWQAVVIYPSRSVEQSNTYPYRALLNSDQVHRVYLSELGELEDLPLGVAAMVLTITEETEAPEKARMLIGRANQEIADTPVKQGIIEMISTIILYKFTNLSQEEISIMLATKREDIRAFREAKEEERQTIALNMLRKNLDIATIAEVTGLTIEQVQALQSQAEQN